MIWAGFQILTSNGDEERVKQSKSTILYVALGIIIIWLAYSIVSWIMRITTNQTAFNIFRPFQIAWIDTAHASYTENERGTFLEYKSRIRSALEELEAEMRLNKQVSVSSLNALKQLVQQASERLPDRDPKTATENQSTKRAVDLAIDLAIQKPNSTSTISTAIRDTAKYINGAKIEKITGNITATPTEGHAPLTVSFRAADIKDPSGTTPPANNHIWWIRENGGTVRILGRGPSLTQDFTQEGTFTIFLDVVSASRNSRGYTDVLPFSQSIPIEVKPKLGEVVLLINGVNVSNLESLKVSPIVASQGIILDATASRAIGNGKITETKWEFGNGNISSHK